MSRRRWAAGLLAALLGAGTIGCQNTPQKVSNIPDPLLVTRKPVDGKPADPASISARADLTPPSMPTQHRNRGDKGEGPVVRLGFPDFVPPPRGSAVAWTNEPEPPPAPKLDHDPDYEWLQGIVEVTGPDRFVLRYAEGISSDYWGGKVCLDPDPRLSGLREGDRVRVIGGLVRDNDRVQVANWPPYPRYRVRSATVLHDRVTASVSERLPSPSVAAAGANDPGTGLARAGSPR